MSTDNNWRQFRGVREVYLIKLDPVPSDDGEVRWVNWKMYPLMGLDSIEGELPGEETLFCGKDGGGTYELELAQVCTSGHVKWDQCQEFNVDDGPLHFCANKEVEDWFNAVRYARDEAAQKLTTI